MSEVARELERELSEVDKRLSTLRKGSTEHREYLEERASLKVCQTLHRWFLPNFPLFL